MFRTPLASAATALTLLVSFTATDRVTACPRPGGYGVARPAYTYRQPVYRSTVVSSAPANPQTAARTQVLAARQEFSRRNYALALDRVNQADKLSPSNADILQFKSLVQFAMSDYKAAAASAYSALSLGRGWDWKTIRELYSKTEQYTEQYHALCDRAKNEPQTAHLQFLVGYHHLMLGHLEPGRAALEKANQLLPGDALTGKLLATLPAATNENPPQVTQSDK